MKNIAETLDEREEEYGSYVDLSDIVESIIASYACSTNWVNMESYQRVSLYMDAMKTARILNGNPDNIDSWHDKAGYAELVAQELMRRKENE